jgi:hypothetical protein
VAAAIGCSRFAGQASYVMTAAEPSAAASQTDCECMSRSARPLSLRAYAELCRLAEAVTLVRAPKDEGQRAELRKVVCDVLACVAAVPSRLSTLGRLASQRLRSIKSEGGIALAGTVRAVGRQGEQYSVNLVLFGEPMRVSVVAPGAPTTPLMPGDRVIVLGYLLDADTSAAGEAVLGSGKAIWGGLCLPVPETQAPARPMR